MKIAVKVQAFARVVCGKRVALGSVGARVGVQCGLIRA